MTAQQEAEMHLLAVMLAKLTEGTGWEAMRYGAIAHCMEMLADFCPVDNKAHAEMRERVKEKQVG